MRCSVAAAPLLLLIGCGPDYGIPLGDAEEGHGVANMLVVECPAGECYDEYVECLGDTGDPLLCEDRYDDCVLDNQCSDDREPCEVEAQEEYEACAGDFCWEEYRAAWLLCECEEEVCLTGEERYCEDQFGPPPLPVAPGRFTVSRRFVDGVLLRGGRLLVENRAWLVQGPGPDGYRGVRLGSIDVGGPMAHLGVKSGDLVRSVNGVHVAELLRDPEAIVALRDRDTIIIGLRRSGKDLQLRYDVIPPASPAGAARRRE